MKQFLLVSALLLGVLSTTLIHAEESVTPETCYDLGASIGLDSAHDFCGVGHPFSIDEQLPDICSGVGLNKHRKNGCKAVVLDIIEDLYGDGECDDFGDYDTDFLRYVLKDQLCY